VVQRTVGIPQEVQLKLTLRRAAMIAGFASAGFSRRSHAVVSLVFTNVGATTSVATVAPGGVFNFSVAINETAATDEVTGADYEISSSTSSTVDFLSRNSSAGLFSSANGYSDAYLNSSPYSPDVLNPTNGTDLGTSLSDFTASVSGPASSVMANYSFKVLPATVPGIYTLNFAGYGGSPNATYLGGPPTYNTTQFSSTAPFILVVSGLIDIKNKDLVIKGAGAAGLSAATAEAALGCNLPGGGNWSGTTGIISSTAAADSTHLTAVGVILNNVNGKQIYGGSLGAFDGTTPGVNDVLVKHTYFGDANLDGKVDGSDYSLIDAGYASGGLLTGWYNGDFNYDGVVDGSDCTLIDNAFNNQGGTLSATAGLAAITAQAALAPAAVPEPAAVPLLAAAAGLLASRRRA
jgi:hypothetical protein